jgi:type II secretory pathway component PulC
MILNIQFSQRTILGIIAVLIFLTLLTIFLTIQQWRSDWELTHQVIPAVTPAQNDAANMIAALPSTHLFGQSLSGEMPISSLQMRVTGIVKVENEEGSLSKAYISVSGQPSKIYQKGDNLPHGVRIYAITPDSVILERDGQLEKLPLPREKLEFKERTEIKQHDTSAREESY